MSDERLQSVEVGTLNANKNLPVFAAIATIEGVKTLQTYLLEALSTGSKVATPKRIENVDILPGLVEERHIGRAIPHETNGVFDGTSYPLVSSNIELYRLYESLGYNFLNHLVPVFLLNLRQGITPAQLDSLGMSPGHLLAGKPTRFDRIRDPFNKKIQQRRLVGRVHIKKQEFYGMLKVTIPKPR